MHSSAKVDETLPRKSLKARLHFAKSSSRRWMLFVWGNILDIASINAYILHTKSTGICIFGTNVILKLIERLRHQPAENATNDSIFDLIEHVGLQRKQKKCHGSTSKNGTEFMCHCCKNLPVEGALRLI